MNSYLLKEQRQNKTKYKIQDQESRMLGGSGDEQNKSKNSENKAVAVPVWFEWSTY